MCPRHRIEREWRNQDCHGHGQSNMIAPISEFGESPPPAWSDRLAPGAVWLEKAAQD
ncbi:flotillin domain protein [Aspergillus luchuensis]|uniref:Flotillin domain protein n=1 Tax=Aspergillus kawachii TaxID=1069201 RepID=A0A146FBX2_ASPKA|nr:flotillin domain protein [Aspergillus luchuensis]